jgi:hypothetical protein
VAETLEWLATEVLAGHVKHAGAAAAMMPAGSAAEGTYTYSAFLGAGPQAGVEEKERLRADFVDTVRKVCVDRWTACVHMCVCVGGGCVPAV